ncbi:MAG: hypothetical protein M3468_08095 [Acidobacteriota bacterium]|nr:hypothetical protein [Acidobacteriota bacterium]
MLQAQSAAPTPIALEDYAKFKRITSAAISADGKWMHYTVTPNDGDATLLVKALDGDKVYEIPRGANPAFSDDGRWVAYFIAPPASEGRGRGRGARGGEPPATGAPAAAATRPFEVIELATGTKSSYPSVGTFAFSPDGEWLLMRPPSAAAAPAAGAAAAGRGGRGGATGEADANAPGTDLLMRRLATGEQRYLGKVGTYAFDEAGKQMAYTVRGQQRLGNGVYLMTLATGEQRTLDSATADYDQLAWSAEGSNLAVLRGDKARDTALRDNVVLTWRGVGTPQVQASTFDPVSVRLPCRHGSERVWCAALEHRRRAAHGRTEGAGARETGGDGTRSQRRRVALGRRRSAGGAGGAAGWRPPRDEGRYSRSRSRNAPADRRRQAHRHHTHR